MAPLARGASGLAAGDPAEAVVAEDQVEQIVVLRTADIWQAACSDLQGIWRLLWSFARRGGRVEQLALRRDEGPAGELARFVHVGLLSTLTYLAGYLLLRTAMNGYVANIVSLALCSGGT